MKTMKRTLAIVLVLVLALACMAIPAMASGTKKYVTTGSVNMRTGPGLSYGIVRSIGKNVSLNATDYRKDNRGVYWVYTSYNGDYGWVSTMNLKQGKAPATRYIYAADGSTYVRSKPNLNGKKLTTMPEGATATYLEKKSRDDRGVVWYKVSYRGTTGWVSSRYTEMY